MPNTREKSLSCKLDDPTHKLSLVYESEKVAANDQIHTESNGTFNEEQLRKCVA